jgi:hypothetical protein
LFVVNIVVGVGIVVAVQGHTALALAKAVQDVKKQDAKQETKDEYRTVRGEVKQFDTGPDEIISGLTLQDGTKVNWPKEITFRFTDIVDQGDRVEASGWWRSKAAGKG